MKTICKNFITLESDVINGFLEKPVPGKIPPDKPDKSPVFPPDEVPPIKDPPDDPPAPIDPGIKDPNGNQEIKTIFML